MRRASDATYWASERAKSRSSVSQSTSQGLAMALNSMRHSRLSRISSKFELVSKLYDHGFHVGREVQACQVTCRRARRLGRRLLVVLEPKRKLAAVGAQAVFRADGVGIEVGEAVVCRRELGYGIPREQHRAVEIRGALRVPAEVRLEVGAVVDVPTVARLGGLRLHTPVVVHESEVEREGVAVESVAPLGKK